MERRLFYKFMLAFAAIWYALSGIAVSLSVDRFPIRAIGLILIIGCVLGIVSLIHKKPWELKIFIGISILTLVAQGIIFAFITILSLLPSDYPPTFMSFLSGFIGILSSALGIAGAYGLLPKPVTK